MLEQVKLILGETDSANLELELKEALKLLVTEDVVITYGPNKGKPSVKLCRDRFADK